MRDLLAAFHASHTTIHQFLHYLLTELFLRHDPLVIDLHNHKSEVISLLQSLSIRVTPSSMDIGSAYDLVQKGFRDEVQMLILNGKEWQFGAAQATVKQILEFRLDEMAKKMQKIAPRLWDVLGILLSATKTIQQQSESMPSGADEDDEEYWVHIDTHSLEGIIEMITQDQKAREQRRKARRTALVTIVSHLCGDGGNQINKDATFLFVLGALAHRDVSSVA
jgi:hypothetical protein